MKASLPLVRKGNSLWSETRKWECVEVSGPLPLPEEGKEFFQFTTTDNSSLLVYRKRGEKGMRELFLVRWESASFAS